MDRRSVGSSPRTRGTPDRPALGDVRGRFIPAYTGNSPPSPLSRPPWTVHPRVHGELLMIFCICLNLAGSSPRTRGTPLQVGNEKGTDRFIPAYTGNSQASWSTRNRSPVHPRVHGELATDCDDVPGWIGSSPRTRGTRRVRVRRLEHGRFIPAYTGNSNGSTSRATRGAVHPRVHGELSPQSASGPVAAGSSPRTRGTQEGHGPELDRVRFIPAYTGNS